MNKVYTWFGGRKVFWSVASIGLLTFMQFKDKLSQVYCDSVVYILLGLIGGNILNKYVLGKERK